VQRDALVEHPYQRGFSFPIMRKVAPLVALLFLISGCHHAPLTYQLLHQSSSTILIPPSLTQSSAPSDISVTINKARKSASSNQSCDIKNDLISLHWRGRTAEVRIKSESYYASATNQSPSQTAPGMYLDPLRSIESFRVDLGKLEWTGCLKSGEAQRLRQILTEHLPFPPYIAFLFRFGSCDVTGILDLTPDFRLQIGSPLYSPGATHVTDHLIGHETAFYVLRSAQNDDRLQISLASVTETLTRQPPVEESVSKNGLSFPQSFNHTRLLFRTRTDATAHASIATLLFTEDPSKLDEATTQRESSSVDSCESVTVSGVTCLTIPPGFGVAPELRVRVNGKDVYVIVGGALEDAIGSSAYENDILKTLQVRRLYQGHLIPIQFDSSSRDILRLVLIPGDDLTWH
jgi:hypothetical protein